MLLYQEQQYRGHSGSHKETYKVSWNSLEEQKDTMDTYSIINISVIY